MTGKCDQAMLLGLLILCHTRAPSAQAINHYYQRYQGASKTTTPFWWTPCSMMRLCVCVCVCVCWDAFTHTTSTSLTQPLIYYLLIREASKLSDAYLPSKDRTIARLANKSSCCAGAQGGRCESVLILLFYWGAFMLQKWCWGEGLLSCAVLFLWDAHGDEPSSSESPGFSNNSYNWWKARYSPEARSCTMDDVAKDVFRDNPLKTVFVSLIHTSTSGPANWTTAAVQTTSNDHLKHSILGLK